MRVRPYEETSLWQRTLADQPNGSHNALRAELRTAYEGFRQRALDLTNEIHALLPNLTVHNIEHLDALWDVASIIAGESYPINPLEAFILGGAFLMHDAGMALAAFPNRMADIQRHVRWREHEIAAWRRRGVVSSPSVDQERSMGEDVRREASFDVLRAEHAKRAETILSLSWNKPGDSHGWTLLPHDGLRESYGQLIGRIAASHHWGVGDITKKLPKSRVPASQPFPNGWGIDAVAIACLLRCADAANIDETRAPSFVYALRRPGGISREHWEFQNRLLPGAADRDALVFHSKRPFSETESSIWWLCYDTVKACSEQLTQSDALLRDEGRPRFAVRSVRGADDPLRVAQTIEVIDWTPVDTTVKVTNVLGLVRSLGGHQLYGDDPIVPLRELIQNAADAVRARRHIDQNFYGREEKAHRRGRVSVRIADDAGDRNKFWLIVEDDGIGMSERVMTGPLLDFGTSLWRSPMAGEEFPGLVVGDSFEPTGRFGIGFYSVFMYADRVRVTSRPADSSSGAHGMARTLEFKEGLARRAVIRDYRTLDDGYLDAGISTRVATRLPQGILDRWRRCNQKVISLEQRLQYLTLGLDVIVELSEGNATTSEVHPGSYIDLSSEDFLHRIFVTRAGVSASDDEMIDKLAPKVAAIRDGQSGRCYGRGVAHLAESRQTPLAIVSVGGLSASGVSSDSWMRGTFIGIVDGIMKSAARQEAEPIVPEECVKSFVSEQVALLSSVYDLSREERGDLAQRLVRVGAEIGSIVFFRLGDQVVSLDDLVTQALSLRRLVFPLAVYPTPIGANYTVGFAHHFRVNVRSAGENMSMNVNAKNVVLDVPVAVRISGLKFGVGNWQDSIPMYSRESLAKQRTIMGELLRKICSDGRTYTLKEHFEYRIGTYKGDPLKRAVVELNVIEG